MRVQNIQFTPQLRIQNPNFHTKPLITDQISFKSKTNEDAEYKRAQKYANKMKIVNMIWPFDLQSYNMQKIEGIQKGIPIFEDLSMQEIAYLFEDLHTIAVKRGCSNQCLHCYADAKPSEKNHGNYVSRMPFEDFIEITSGLKTLRKRLGFTPIKYHGQAYTDLFYDADGLEISLFDKNGREYDFTELNDIFYEGTKSKAVFDTAGWNPNNKKLQNRAEKYVKYFNEPENAEKMHQINLSISPFNAIYAKAIELGFNPEDYDVKNQPWHPENDGKKLSKEEILYNIYINRMANMLMTFSPLIGEKKFNIISRPVKNFETNMKYHTEKDYNIIKRQILDTLRAKLYIDLASEKKYIKNREKLKYCMYIYSEKLSQTDTDLIMSGRFEKLYKEKNPEVKQSYIDEMFEPISDFRENFELLKGTNNLQDLPKKFLKIIDANGKLYLYDGFRMIPTEIGLNISSRDKETPPLAPAPEEYLITSEMIKNYYKK